ncbi:MAG TPA: hypothetical protein VNH11_08480 [Pirellulales bacterium]|nr:hypothetical protein [Pirellulales bacterium]
MAAGEDPLVEAARAHGLPPEQIEIVARRAAGRSCGDCTACCAVKSVRELGKPSQTACRHVCQAGCGIYDRRPASCRDYACLWRQGLIEGDQRRRPDQLGVLIDYEPFAGMPGTLRLVVWEVVPGAAQSEKVRYLVDKLLQAHTQIKAVAYCAAGQPAQHDFPIDRQAYPGDDPPPTLPIVSFDSARGVATYEFRRAG